MEKIKKGDIVSRKSHKFDVLFSVERIMINNNGMQIAILKGITARIVADACIDDLIVIDNKKLDDSLRSLDIRIEDRINYLIKKEKNKVQYKERNSQNLKSGKIFRRIEEKPYKQGIPSEK